MLHQTKAALLKFMCKYFIPNQSCNDLEFNLIYHNIDKIANIC